MELLKEKDRGLIGTVAFWCTVLMLTIIPVQIAVLSIWPMPSNGDEWINLFAAHPVVAMLHLDFLYLINMALLCVIYLGIFVLLMDEERGLALIALVAGLVGAAAYFPTVRVFEIQRMVDIYEQTDDGSLRNALRGVIEGMLAVWRGTGYDAYYVLGAFSLLFFALAMFRSNRFGRGASTTALLAAVFMFIPSTAGTMGMIFSLLSLIPWMVLLVLLLPKFRKSADSHAPETPE